jgi:hypothetical protein
MSDIHKSLRLGDLLVEKGLITRPQLRQAIEIQQNLQSQRFGNKNINVKAELGSILIELGFISRQQLQSNLNWQRRLKATTAVMVFIAPLLTAACGGGAGASSTTSNIKTEVSSLQASADTSPKPESASKSSSSAQAVSSPVSSTAVSSSSSPAIPSASSSTSSSVVDGSVSLYWDVPNQRENGEYLDITEIGGYEVRYKLKGDYEFQIATFDTNGLYSGFVGIDPS